MLRRQRKLREQAAAVRDLDGTGAAGGSGAGAGAGDGLLSLGDTHASDAFSFLPPGQPAGGEGACGMPGLGGEGCVGPRQPHAGSCSRMLCSSGLAADADAPQSLPTTHAARLPAVRTIDNETGVVV